MDFSETFPEGPSTRLLIFSSLGQRKFQGHFKKRFNKHKELSFAGHFYSLHIFHWNIRQNPWGAFNTLLIFRSSGQRSRSLWKILQQKIEHWPCISHYALTDFSETYTSVQKIKVKSYNVQNSNNNLKECSSKGCIIHLVVPLLFKLFENF